MTHIFTPHCKFTDYETDISNKSLEKSLGFN